MMKRALFCWKDKNSYFVSLFKHIMFGDILTLQDWENQ